MPIDKNIVKNNFLRGAKSYEEFGVVQNIAAKKLCEFAFSYLKKTNLKILDLGSGSGFVAKNILSYNLNHQIFEIDLIAPFAKNYLTIFTKCDIEKLCFKPNSFDLIISSFALQWIENFEDTFIEINKILKPGGIFIFAIPDHESLKELKIASINSGCNFNFKELPKRENFKKNFYNSNFNLLNSSQETIKQSFSTGVEAIKSIKKIGANYSQFKKNKIKKSALKEFDNFFKKPSNDASCEVSWVVNYFILSK